MKKKENHHDNRSSNDIARITCQAVLLLQLISHAYVTRRLWWSHVHRPPRVGLMPLASLSLEQVAAGTYLMTLMVALLWLLMTLLLMLVVPRKRHCHIHSTTIFARLATFSFARLATFSWSVVALSECLHWQPPVVTGLALWMCDGDTPSQRLIVAGTWLWSGWHKMNPHFLCSTDRNTMVDPVLTAVFGTKWFEEYRTLLRLVTALTEATCGGILLSFWNDNVASVSKWSRLAAQLCTCIMVVMHGTILVRLLQTGWNYHVVGWNVSYLVLAVLLWRPQWSIQQNADNTTTAKTDTTMTTTTTSNTTQRHTKFIMRMACFLIFVVLPAGVTWGWVDPYWGHALYTDNVPALYLELPSGDTHLDKSEDLVWATTHNGRVVANLDSIQYHLRTQGSVGYPAEWAMIQWVEAYCRQARQQHAHANNSRFMLYRPVTGTRLLQTTWKGLWNNATANEELLGSIQDSIVQEGCNGKWRPFLPSASDVTAFFSSTTMLEGTVHLYWADERSLRLESNGTVTQAPTLVFQSELQVEPVSLETFVGHMFVAAPAPATETLDEDPPAVKCYLTVWRIVPSENDDPQHFVLTEQSAHDNRVVFPGLKRCAQIDEQNEEQKEQPQDVSNHKEPAHQQTRSQEL